MKKVIAATLFAVAAAFSAPAAHQYEIGSDGLNIREPMSLKLLLSDDSFFRNDDLNRLNVRIIDGTAAGDGVMSGEFIAGESIATRTGSGETLFDQFALTEKDGSLTYLHFAGGRNHETIDIRFFDDISDRGATPVGQPLPGVLGALLLGGGVLGVLSIKRRKKTELPHGNDS